MTRVSKSKLIQECSTDIMGRKCFSAGVLKIIVESCNIHAAPIRGGDFWESAVKTIVESWAPHGRPEQQPKDPDKEEDPDTEEDASPALPRPKPRGKASSAPRQGRQGRQDRRQNNRPPPGPPGGDLSLGNCADCEKLRHKDIYLKKAKEKLRWDRNNWKKRCESARDKVEAHKKEQARKILKKANTKDILPPGEVSISRSVNLYVGSQRMLSD